MPIVKILKNDGRFMEGWMPGEMVEMDDIAVATPLKEGFVELVSEVKTDKPADKKPRKTKKVETAE